MEKIFFLVDKGTSMIESGVFRQTEDSLIESDEGG